MPTRQTDLGNSLIQVPSSRVTGFVPRTAEANEDSYSTVSRVTGSGISAGKRSVDVKKYSQPIILTKEEQATPHGPRTLVCPLGSE